MQADVKAVLLLCVLLVLFSHPSFAFAASEIQNETGRRVALVIGNRAYPERLLRNPLNDARVMSETLEASGFQVQYALDCGQEVMEKAINSFVSSLQPGDTALFYYSGHGILLGGATYLLPVDMSADDERRVSYYTHSAELIGARMANAGAALVIILVDACREGQSRDTGPCGPGSAKPIPPSGACIIFSTAAGSPAVDSPGSDVSLFTGILAEKMLIPGKSLHELFVEVSDSVIERSGGKQQPVLCLAGRAGEFRFASDQKKSTADGKIGY